MKVAPQAGRAVIFDNGYRPPPGFFFTVMVAGSGTVLQLSSMADASFQEATGLEAKIELQAVKEGGENRFVHQLPALHCFARPARRRALYFV